MHGGCILVNVGILECVSHPCWIWVHVHFCELLVQLGHFFFGILHECGRPNFQVCNSGAQTVEILGTFGLKLLKTDGARCIYLLGLFLDFLLHLLKLSVHFSLKMFKNLLGGGLQNSFNTSRKFFSVGSTWAVNFAQMFCNPRSIFSLREFFSTSWEFWILCVICC